MMMLNRLSLTVAMLMGCVSFANADTFLGRNVAVADGRASGGPAPMVVLLHGALGTGEQVMRSSGFSQLADEYGLIVLAPNGHNRRWLDGRQGPDLRM